MSRSGFQYALAALGAATVADADLGIIRSIHAGLSAAAATNRELSDLEQLALDNLMGQLAPQTSDGEEDHSLDRPPSSSEGAEGDASASQDEVTQPGAGAPVSAPSAPSAGEQALNRAADFYEQKPTEHIVEAQEPVDLGLTETVHSPPFQPQEDTEAEHLEDDGA